MDLDTQQMMNSFVRKRIMNSPLLQISSLGKNVFITKLPNLQKISLRHCGIKVSFFTMTKMKTNDCFFLHENDETGDGINTNHVDDLDCCSDNPRERFQQPQDLGGDRPQLQQRHQLREADFQVKIGEFEKK